MKYSSKSVIRLDSVAKSYRNKQVIKSVSLELETHSVVGLLGPNGAGKTTLFYIICGLVQSSQGQVFLDNRPITHLPMHRRAKLGIGYLPQESSIFTKLSVENNIRSILELHHSDWQPQLESLLNDFNLQAIRRSLGYQLSGGERRRVEIARALAANPKFILLDEPFAGVDPISITETKQVVRSLAERGIGVIITDHNVRETLSICDKAYILDSGELIAEGSAAELINSQRVKDVYLGKSFRL